MSNYNYSDLLNKYLQDNISREELHALEKRALDDPFLMDAMEGYATSDLKESLADIDQIKIKVKKHNKSLKINYKYVMSIAAGVTLLLSAFFVFQNYSPKQKVLSDQVEPSSIKKPNKESAPLASGSATIEQESQQSNTTSVRQKEDEKRVAKKIAKHKIQNQSHAKDKTIPPSSIEGTIKKDEVVMADLEDEGEQEVISSSKVTEAKDYNRSTPRTTKPMRSRGRIMINRIEAPREDFKKSELPTEEVEVKPILGLAAFENYINKHKKSFDFNGKVVIDFTIRPDGQAINFRVFQSLCRSCDEDAIRLIREGGSWLVTPPDEEVDVRYEIEY